MDRMIDRVDGTGMTNPQDPHFYALRATDEQGGRIVVLEDGIPMPAAPEQPSWAERPKAPRGFRRAENGRFERLLAPQTAGTPEGVAQALRDWYAEDMDYLLRVGGDADRVVVTVRANFAEEVGTLLTQFTNAEAVVGEVRPAAPVKTLGELS